MKLLITGASGLIGTELIKTAKLDVYGTVYKNPVAGIKTFEGDLTDNRFLDSLPKFDYIIHTGGYGQPKKFMAEPLNTIKLNTTVLIKLFEKLNPQGSLLYLSSSEVYSGAKPPYKESDIGTTNPSHPRACYIEAKRCGEAICNQLGGKIARISLVYGPARQDDGRAMYDFIRQGLKGQINLIDQGQAKRTYCYVSDAVELLWQILFKGKGTYNVGGHSSISILSLAFMIGRYLGAEVTPGDGQPLAAPEDVSLDMTKTEREFNKTDYIPLTEGLERTINHFKQGGE